MNYNTVTLIYHVSLLIITKSVQFN